MGAREQGLAGVVGTGLINVVCLATGVPRRGRSHPTGERKDLPAIDPAERAAGAT